MPAVTAPVAPRTSPPPGPPQPLGSVRAVVDRLVTEAGDLPVAGEPLGKVLPRQLVFEVAPDSPTTFAVAGATDAARAALATNPRWKPLVQTLAAGINSPEGARLRAVAFTDSPAGFMASDLGALLEEGMGTRGQSRDNLRWFVPQLTQRDPTRLPAGHTVTSAGQEGTGIDHAAWITIGPEVSADVRYFLGDAPQLGAQWPAKITAAGRDSDPQKGIAALAGETLAHEGWHARLSRLGLPRFQQFPFDVDEGRTQLANHLAGSAATMTRALGMDDVKARNTASADEVYSRQVTDLDAKLDRVGVPADAATRLGYLEQQPLDALATTVTNA